MTISLISITIEYLGETYLGYNMKKDDFHNFMGFIQYGDSDMSLFNNIGTLYLNTEEGNIHNWPKVWL